MDIYYSINWIAWYLSTAAFLYFMFPYIARQIGKIKKNLTAYIGMMLVYVVQIVLAVLVGKLAEIEAIIQKVPDLVHWFTYVFPIYRLGDFAIGCLLGYIFMNRKDDDKECVWCSTFLEGIIIAGLIIALNLYRSMGGSLVVVKYTLIFTPLSCILVYLFAQKKGLITRILTNKWSVYLGNISGYAFLVHRMVILYATKMTEDKMTVMHYRWGIAIISFIITLMLVKLGILIKQKGKQRHL